MPQPDPNEHPWYWLEQAGFFRGIFMSDKKPKPGWHGPYPTYRQTKHAAIAHYVEIQKEFQQFMRELRAYEKAYALKFNPDKPDAPITITKNEAT